jgi:ribosomal protein S9
MINNLMCDLGQAQAIKLGLGKALLIHNSELKPVLRKGKLHYFDSQRT